MREEELPELDTLVRDACQYDIKGGAENKQGKANVLLQVRGGGCGGGAAVGKGCRQPAPMRRYCTSHPGLPSNPFPNPRDRGSLFLFPRSPACPQAYISRARVESFSLTADLMYVSQVRPVICTVALFVVRCCIAAPRTCVSSPHMSCHARGCCWAAPEGGVWCQFRLGKPAAP